jgi:hypothetical protein
MDKAHMPAAGRGFKDGVFTSTALPEMRLPLPKSFKAIGRNSFILYEIARVDRHHFVDPAADGAVRRAVILHFESFLPGTHQTFNYKIPGPDERLGPNYQFSPEKVPLGGHDYIHNTWFFDAAANIQENPEGELVRTAQLFKQHGLELPGALQMSRYVRVVGADRKSELILFYLEPLDASGLKIDDFVEGGAGERVFEKLSAALTRRSYRLFSQVRDG